MNKLITEIRSIVSCNDFELNYERPQKLQYKFTYPKSKKIKGIVFLIQGFGTDLEYMDNLREFIAEEFSVMAVDVYYHCFFSRLENGASLEFDDMDLVILQDFIDKYKVDFSSVNDINTNSVVTVMNENIGRLKAINVLSTNFKLSLPITIIPKNNEYQNFGMMQAIDHINVLSEIENMGLDFIENYTTTLFGTSHGGYLAHLIAKIAPHKIDNVIDNSSYVKPPLNYFIGKEINITQPEYILGFEHINLNCFVQTLWTTNIKSNFLFTKSNFRIRNLNDTEHLETLSKISENKINYISYHSVEDEIAIIGDKIDFYKKLNSLGFKAKLNIIDNESQVDGRFIKNLSHGMNMSLKELAKRELEKIVNSDNTYNKDKNMNITVSYQCDNITYTFIYDNNKLKIKMY